MKEKEEKLKILAAADIHGDVGIAKKLAEKAKKNKVDLVVLLGDLHGMQGGEDVITPFKKANQRVVFVPGNWDSSFEANTLRDLHKVKNLDGYYATYKGVGIVGIGNPDFQLELDEKTTFDKLKKNFDKNADKDSVDQTKLKKKNSNVPSVVVKKVNKKSNSQK